MKKALILGLSLAALAVAPASAGSAHIPRYIEADALKLTLKYQNAAVSKTETGDYCIKRAPKTDSRGTATFLFCYPYLSPAFDFYIDNSGHNSDDPDSTTYLENMATGEVLYSR